MQSKVPLLLNAAIFVFGIARNEACKMGDTPSDIVFLVDESGSVGRTNFRIQIQFVEEFVSNFSIGPKKIQVGLITFSSDTKTEFNLNTCADIKCILNQLRKVNYTHSGGTVTDKALDYVRTDSFSLKNGDRPGVPNILIIMTDGKSNYAIKTRDAATKVKTAGIIVLAVGIGAGVDNSELNNMASSLLNVINVGSFNNLSEIDNLIRHKTCKAITNGVVSFLTTTQSKVHANAMLQGTKMTQATNSTARTVTATTKMLGSFSSKGMTISSSNRNWNTNKAPTKGISTMKSAIVRHLTEGTTHVSTIGKSSMKTGTSSGTYTFQWLGRVNKSKNRNERGRFELKRPGWMYFLEIICLTTICIIISGATICCCKRFCCVLIRHNNDDDDHESQKWKRKFRKPQAKPSVIPM